MEEDWQHASAAYRRADTDIAAGEDTRLRRAISGLISIGPWVLVHLIFIASAIGTAYMTIAQAQNYVRLSWPTLVGAILLLGLVIFASVLHVVSQLYS